MAAPVWNTNDVPSATDFNVWFTNVLFAVKTANESVTSSTTLQNDDHLVLALAASSTYIIDGLLIIDGASTGDFQMDFTKPSGSTNNIYIDSLAIGASGLGDKGAYLWEDSGTPNFGTITTGSHSYVRFTGLSQVTTAGNLQLRWAQATSTATATRVLTGSWMSARRVA